VGRGASPSDVVPKTDGSPAVGCQLSGSGTVENGKKRDAVGRWRGKLLGVVSVPSHGQIAERPRPLPVHNGIAETRCPCPLPIDVK
jgi:hypothetical protein